MPRVRILYAFFAALSTIIVALVLAQRMLPTPWPPSLTTVAQRGVPSSVIATTSQEQSGEIDSLLKRMVSIERTEGTITTVNGPDEATWQYVQHRLLEIANETEQSRSQVVGALIRVLEDPESEIEGEPAGRWTTAVNLLSELRATEAIEILVRNLDQTGENFAISSQHYRPVVRALARIGEPAVPRLIEALSDENRDIAFFAETTLAEIGQPAFGRLEEALRLGGIETRAGAASALSYIGGKQARIAIQQSIDCETDQPTLAKLKDALVSVSRHSRPVVSARD